MPIRSKNSRFWHYDFQIKGRRFYGSCDTQDFEEAKAVEAQARVQAKALLAAEPKQPAQGYTLSQAIGTYYADVSSHQPSALTSFGQGKSVLSVLDPNKLLMDLTQADLQLFVTAKRSQIANGTINRHLQFLGRAVRHMAETYGAEIPSLNFKKALTKEPGERIRELSLDEQKRLFKELRSDLHAFAQFALLTGARRATIASLRWSDVDFTTKRIFFRLKGGLKMHFPMNTELQEFLLSLPRSELPEHTDYVLTYLDTATKHRKRIISNGGGLAQDWADAVKRAKIPDFRFHDLRHTFATRLLRQTGNLKLVSRLLGHTTIDTTARYAHVLDEDLEQALERFSPLSNRQSRSKSRSKT
jgi:integrase